jgi:two-component system sensor histidine kinase TctE
LLRPSASSLTRRLLLALLVPVTVLALLLGVGGALMINKIVEGVNDRLLTASVRAIADTLAVEEGELTLDLPPFSLGMLENDSRDNVYYSVRNGRELVTGYEDLPVVQISPAAGGEPTYSYSTYRGMPIRIAALSRRVPRIDEPVVVQVAETLTARTLLKQRMLAGLAVLELVLLAAIALLLPLAVRVGLFPLTALTDHMRDRRPDDFAPLPLAHVPSELGGLVAAFNNLLARLDKAVEGMRRFTADASHQMRTPLSILRTHLNVVRTSGTSSPEGQASLADMESAAHRLQRLLVQLLTLARAESASEARLTGREATDIVELTQRIALEFAPMALKAHIELVFDTPKSPLLVSTQPALATELLSNVIENAIRYNKEGGEVLVGFADGGASVAVLIEDDGPGIPLSDREAVFERFRRLESHPQRPGSGLGLAIVKALAEAVGASISLREGHAGQGLLVEVSFPKAEERETTSSG